MKVSFKRKVDESYDIVIGINLFPKIARDLSEQQQCPHYAIITDHNVNQLYGILLEEALKLEGLEADIFSFKPGEQSKTIDTCMEIVAGMSAKYYGRDSIILALGGGVVGDLAGFIASIYRRGIGYIQIPTTLLAQTDSSIGGKTALNTKTSKNTIGTFKQPKAVYIDVGTLVSLNDKHYKSGLGETIKHAIVFDAGFFNYLNNNLEQILDREISTLLCTIEQACSIKRAIVEHDPYDKGMRRILNYGHTIGQAIESLSSYTILHGEAVAIGMMVEGRIAVELGYFSESELERQAELLKRAGLPTTVPAQISNEDILMRTYRDKKAVKDKARYALPKSIGTMHHFRWNYITSVENSVVLKALEKCR